MTAAPAIAEPITTTLVVLFRPGRGRWKKVGTARNYAEALAMVRGPGDWWFSTAAAEVEGEQPGLFDAEEEDTERRAVA
jgi:hypothetical protein